VEARLSQSVHEPDAKVMSAEDVWADAQLIADLLHENLSKVEPTIGLQVPLSMLLSALSSLSRDELINLRRRIDELLAA
jgi:hypothetical protein